MSQRDMLRDIAHAVLDMLDENDSLRRDVAVLRDYRRKYEEQLQRGIEHSQTMLAGILDIAMTPGVMDAISKANEGKQ